MKLFYFILLLLPFSVKCQNNFSQDWLSCIVELQKPDVNGVLQNHGTGFTLYNYRNNGNDGLYIVTCAHVLKNPFIYVRIPAVDTASKILGKKNLQYNVDGRLWFYDGFSFATKIDLFLNKTFIKNDSLDIAIIKFDVSVPSIDTIQLVKLKGIAQSRIAKKERVEVATGLYFVGFPLGIGSSQGYYQSKKYSDSKINPLVRGGIMAWKSDETSEFLVDGISYAGNSGSPVFSQINPWGDVPPSLVGMVLGHLSDITVEQVDINQGLVRCIWIDEILKLRDEFEKLGIKK